MLVATEIYEPTLCYSDIQCCLIDITPETARMLLKYMDLILKIRKENKETVDIILWDGPEAIWVKELLTDFYPTEESDENYALVTPLDSDKCPEVDELDVYEEADLVQRVVYPHCVVWRIYIGDFLVESASIDRKMLENIAEEKNAKSHNHRDNQ